MTSALNNTKNINQILCQKHFLPCQYLQIDSDNSDSIFACTDCAFTNKNYEQCLLLHDIIDRSDEMILTSWPLLDEKELIGQIKSFTPYQGDEKLIQKDIIKFFEDLQNELIQKLQAQKKNMLLYAESISEKASQLFAYYREIAQFDTLKNVIDSNTQKQQKADQILQIFNTNKQNQEDKKNKIKQQLSQLNQYQIIDLNILNSFKDSILSQIQLIEASYLPELQLFSKKNLTLIEQLQISKKQNNILLKENKNLDTLLNLISNKTNNCNESYLQSVNSELFKIQDLINVLNFDKDVFKQGKKQIPTENLNQDQVECIEKFISKIVDLNKQVEISNWRNFNVNGKQSYDNAGNLKFEIVKQGNFIFYMKIKQDCIYRIVIKLQLQNQTENLFIGLVGKPHKDSQYVHDNSIINSFTAGTNYGDRGVSKLTKGKCLRDLKYPQEYNKIEITFCVKNKMFQVCDYPKRENINEISDNKLNLIDTNQEYYLGFELHHINSSLTILECEELQQQN